MPIRRNRPNSDNFNRKAELPFQLRLEDFEIADLTKYQADVYLPLNRALRGLEPVTMADLVMAKKIDRAIARAAIPRDMIVYRGFRRNVVNELEAGDTFTDNGFSSSTLSETVARERFAYGGGAIFQFVARKGTHAIYLDDLVKFPKPELEILFPRGTCFRILSKEIRHGITYFMVELISRSRSFHENNLFKQTSGRNINSLQLKSIPCPLFCLLFHWTPAREYFWSWIRRKPLHQILQADTHDRIGAPVRG